MGACLCCFGPGASSLDLALMLADELLSIIHANDARLLHRPPPSPTTPPPFVRLSSTLHLFPPFFVSSLYILFPISWITRIGFFFFFSISSSSLFTGFGIHHFLPVRPSVFVPVFFIITTFTFKSVSPFLSYNLSHHSIPKLPFVSYVFSLSFLPLSTLSRPGALQLDFS